MLRKQSIPENIYRHSLRVCQVASFLVRKLNERGKDIDIHEVEAGALLHDISKMQGILEKKDHALLGAKLLMEWGYYSISEIVRQHVKLDLFSYTIEPAVIVNYADKRVKHHEIVSLEDRFNDLYLRYGNTEDSIIKIKTIQREAELIEELIFSEIPMEPDEINLLNFVPEE